MWYFAKKNGASSGPPIWNAFRGGTPGDTAPFIKAVFLKNGLYGPAAYTSSGNLLKN